MRSSAPSSRANLVALCSRALWHGLIPVLLAGVALRYLIVPLGEGASVASALAVNSNAHRLAAGVALVLFFSALARYWLVFLPATHELGSRRRGLSLRSAGVTGFAVAGAALVAWLLRTTVAQTFAVDGVSMLPALEPSDEIVAEKLAYRSAKPRRGDIIVVSARPGPPGTTSESVKRVIGLPGDHIVVGDELSINGFRVPACDAGRYLRSVEGRIIDGRVVVEFLGDAAYLVLVHTGDHVPPPVERTVGLGELFVLGDDRDLSVDSRAWSAAGAPVRSSDVVGRVRRVAWRDAWSSRSPLERVFRRVELSTHIEGIDTRELMASVAACLAARPAQTEPPSPRPNAVGPDAQAKR